MKVHDNKGKKLYMVVHRINQEGNCKLFIPVNKYTQLLSTTCVHYESTTLWAAHSVATEYRSICTVLDLMLSHQLFYALSGMWLEQAAQSHLVSIEPSNLLCSSS